MKFIFSLLFFVSHILTAQNGLPEWFLNPPVSDNNVFYSIGISDPGIDEKNAYLQAEMRAKYVFNLMNAYPLQISSKLESVSNGIFNKNYPKAYFEIVNKSLSKNNEALVLLKITYLQFNENEKVDSINIKGLMDRFEQYQPGITNTISELSFKIFEDDFLYKYYYQSSSSNDSIKILSTIDIKNGNALIEQKKFDITRNYSYPNYTNKVTASKKLFPNINTRKCTLQKGLWYAYFN
jgi:hypothetical protein